MSFYKISTSACLLIFVLFAVAGAAQASDISLFVGAEMPGSVEHQSAKMPLDNGPVFGLRYGNDFVRYLGLEHTFAYSPDFMFPSNNDCGSAEAAQACWGEAKGFIYNSNLLLNFPDMDDRMVPFLTAASGLFISMATGTFRLAQSLPLTTAAGSSCQTWQGRLARGLICVDTGPESYLKA